MSQTWHPDDSRWPESAVGDNSAAAPYGVLERDQPFVVPLLFSLTNSDVVAQEPHLVLACAPYDDDEDDGE